MDPIVIVIIIVVGMPLAVVWALATASRLRGPIARPESRRPVGSLVTEVIPDEHPDDEQDPASGAPEYRIDSAPPGPDPELRGPETR